MSEGTMKRYSLDEIQAMRARGESLTRSDAPERDDQCDAGFWKSAVVVRPRASHSVHLRLDADVLDYFKAITGGKGHITRMQAVLKAYVEAHKKGLVPPDSTR